MVAAASGLGDPASAAFWSPEFGSILPAARSTPARLPIDSASAAVVLLSGYLDIKAAARIALPISARTVMGSTSVAGALRKASSYQLAGIVSPPNCCAKEG